MSSVHAFFSLGLLSGATITSIFVELNISFFINSLVFIAIISPFNLICARSLGKDLNNKNDNNHIFFLWPLIIFILVIITIANSFAEGSVDAWGALYMRDYILVKGFEIGIATLFFNIFMVIGRFSGDRMKDILGIYNLLFILFVLSILGLITIFVFKSIFSSIIGFSLLGMGISNLVPLSYSVAGKIKGVDSAVGISIISISAFGVFMIAPALLGLVANFYGIRFVYFPLIFLFILCLLIVLLSKKIFN